MAILKRKPRLKAGQRKTRKGVRKVLQRFKGASGAGIRGVKRNDLVKVTIGGHKRKGQFGRVVGRSRGMFLTPRIAVQYEDGVVGFEEPLHLSIIPGKATSLKQVQDRSLSQAKLDKA